MISELTRRPSPVDIRVHFLQWNIAKEIYTRTATAHITKNMKTGLNIIREILLNSSWYNLKTPIAHLEIRDPDFNVYSDACLETAGAQVQSLKFWWHVEWPDTIKSLTRK